MNTVLFVVFPYVAVFVAVFGGIYRYYSNRFSYSALSSELLESRQLFWGSVSWHYGIVLILLAHLLAFLFPGTTATVLGTSYRLAVWELIGLSLGQPGTPEVVISVGLIGFQTQREFQLRDGLLQLAGFEQRHAIVVPSHRVGAVELDCFP